MKRLIFSVLLLLTATLFFSQMNIIKNESAWGLKNSKGDWVFRPVNDTVMRFRVVDSNGVINVLYLGVKGKITFPMDCSEANVSNGYPFFRGAELMLTDSIGKMIMSLQDLYVSFSLQNFDLDRTSRTSISIDPCLRFIIYTVYDRLFPENFIFKQGGKYGMLSWLPGMKKIIEPIYDTIIATNYPANFYACRINDKYDYYKIDGNKINAEPADTLYEFKFSSDTENGEYDENGRALLCLLTGSKIKSLPYVQWQQVSYEDPETGEWKEEMSPYVTVLPKISGGKLTLYNEKFEVLEQDVEDIAFAYNENRYGEGNRDGNGTYTFHPLSQTDTAGIKSYPDFFYVNPGSFPPQQLGALKKSGQWTIYDIPKFRQLPNFVYKNNAIPAAVKINESWLLSIGGKYCMFDTAGTFYNQCDFDAIGGYAEVNTGSDSAFKPKLILQFRKNGKWGLVDSKGKIVVQPIYAGFHTLDHGTYLVNKGGNREYLRYKQTKPPVIYNYPGDGSTPVSDKETVIEQVDSFYNGGKFGIISPAGEIIIPAAYSYLDIFDSGYVALKGGKEIIRDKPFEITYGEWENDKKKIEYYEKSVGGKTIYFDLNGKKLKEEDAYYSPVKNYAYGEITYYIKEKDGKYGITDANKKDMISPRYEKLEVLQMDYNHVYLIAELKGRKGLMTPKGKLIIPVEFSYLKYYAGKFIALKKDFSVNEKITLVSNIEGQFPYSDFYFTKENGIIIDTSGKIIMEGIDSLVSVKSDGMGAAEINVFKNGKRGYFSGEGYVPAEYDEYTRSANGKGYIVRLGKFFGGYSNYGLRFEPSADTAYFTDHYFIYRKKEKTGVYTIHGEEILKPDWIKISSHPSPDNFLVITGENGTGLITDEKKLEPEIPAVYDSIDVSLSGVEARIIKVWKNGLLELYSLAMQKKMTESKFEAFEWFTSNYRGKVNGKWGLYGFDASEQIKPEYNSILWAEDQQLYMLEANGNKTFLDAELNPVADGNERWEKSMIYRFSKSSASAIESFKWESANGPFGCDATALMIDSDGAWWLGTGSSGGVFVSRDEGKTWKEKNNGIGPVHVLDIRKFRDTIFIRTAVSGNNYFEYKADFKDNDGTVRNYKEIFYFKKETDSWIKVRSEYSRWLGDTLDEIVQSEKDKASGQVYIETEFSGATTIKDPVIIYRYEESGKLKDSLMTRFPMDFDKYSQKVTMYKDKVIILCKSGLYVADFKLKKMERNGLTGLLATDITSMRAFSNGDLLAVSGTHAVWKLKAGKWQNKFDAWNAGGSAKRIFNNIDFDNISWNSKGEGLFSAEGTIYRISADGEKIEILYQDKSADGANNKCSWNGTNSFYLFYDTNNSDYKRRVGVIDINTKKVLSADSSEYRYSNEGFFPDNDGHTWRMNSNYLYRTDDSASSFFSQEIYEGKRAFSFFGKGDLVVSDIDAGVLNIWNNASKTWVRFNFKAKAQITAFCVDNRNRIFIAANYQYDGTGCGAHTYVGPSKLYYLKFNGQNFEVVEIENKINPRVISLAPHPAGGVWVGTCGSGLHYLKY